jgi:hypothetical protein
MRIANRPKIDRIDAASGGEYVSFSDIMYASLVLFYLNSFIINKIRNI